MIHKYANLLTTKGITNCPCHTSQAHNRLAYRFVELPAWSLANYIPRGQMPGVPPRPPKPLNIRMSANALAKQNEKQCSIWGGLSMFVTEPQARAFYDAVLKDSPWFNQTHIAELQLTVADGWCTTTDQNGHFDLHEADTAVIFTAVQNQIAI